MFSKILPIVNCMQCNVGLSNTDAIAQTWSKSITVLDVLLRGKSSDWNEGAVLGISEGAVLG